MITFPDVRCCDCCLNAGAHAAAMAVDDKSDIVTKFLLDTCLPLQPSRHHVLAAAARCATVGLRVYESGHGVLVRKHVGDYSEGIPLVSGSSAEFYIQPMLPHVGDVDIMMHRSTVLAIPEGYPPPTELPAEFRSHLVVYEIIDSEYPCYVYLSTSYLLTEDSVTGKYTAIRLPLDERKDVSQVTFRSHHKCMGMTHGPALTLRDIMTEFPVDGVYCVRCLLWPLQAADWLRRHRKHGWPDSTTINSVTTSGCDMVQLADPQCREDNWSSWYQFRLSFSRAEIVLLNSWMPVQQIVYHVLRVFVKTEQFAGFSNYHIKTLTLWACELKPQSWWLDDTNIVKVCVTLLYSLADCLMNKGCRHYFVNNCNLLDNMVHSEVIELNASQLLSTTQLCLSTWLVNNYLWKCARLCPDSVSRLFDDVSTRTKLQNAVSAVVDWRQNSVLGDVWRVCIEAENYVSLTVSMMSLTVRSAGCWISELAKINLPVHDYFIAVAFLHISIKTTKGLLNDELLDVLVTILGQFVGKRRYCNHLSSILSLSQAVMLMKVVASTSPDTMLHLQLELSRKYLYRALRCNDPDRDSIYCLANVYLAVLYFTSGQYQTAIDHCTLVMKSHDHSQCSSHAVQGDLIPKIDDNSDTVLGLAVFYQYIQMVALNQQQTHCVSVFTTNFWHIICTSNVCLSRNLTISQKYYQVMKFNDRQRISLTRIS